MKRALSDDNQVANGALTDIGLIIERHTQNRYKDRTYKSLFTDYFEAYNFVLEEFELDRLRDFLFFYALNKNENKLTVIWCLGKCYGQNIYPGMENLLKLFNENDEVCEQLIYSINALFDFRVFMPKILEILNNSLENNLLPKTKEILENIPK